MNIPETTSLPMTEADRAFLAARAEQESAAGRMLYLMHVLFFAVLVLLGKSEGLPRARGPFFVAAIVLVSGFAWSWYNARLQRRIAADLDAGMIASSDVLLASKRRLQRKSGWAYCLYFEPHLPRRKTEVSQPVYDSLSEGDRVRVRFFPVSRILSSAQRTGA